MLGKIQDYEEGSNKTNATSNIEKDSFAWCRRKKAPWFKIRERRDYSSSSK